MSCLLVLQQYDNVFMGADTAVSTVINDKIYRINTNGKKMFIIDNQLIFCTGVWCKIKITKVANQNSIMLQ